MKKFLSKVIDMYYLKQWCTSLNDITLASVRMVVLIVCGDGIALQTDCVYEEW